MFRILPTVSSNDTETAMIFDVREMIAQQEEIVSASEEATRTQDVKQVQQELQENTSSTACGLWRRLTLFPQHSHVN